MVLDIQRMTFALASCMLSIAVSTTYAWQVSFSQDTIAYNDKFNNRQSVAFDAKGNLHVAYSGQVGTNAATREIYYVTDSADTYSSRLVTSNSVDDNYPTLVVDKNNGVHVGFLGRDAGNLFQIQYSRLVNGAFTTPLFITSGGLNKATPQCAIGRDSVMHFVYHTFPPTGTQNAFYRKFDLRDSTFSAEQQLTDAGVTGDFDSGIAVDTSGFVHIVVKSGSGFGGPMKYFTNRTGTLLETTTGVADAVDYPRLLVDKRNVVHILYRNSTSEILYTVNNASGTFGTPVPLSPAGQRPSGYHNFAIDDQNRLHVVYQSSVSTSGRGWYFVHGKDGTFSDTTLVSDLPPGYVTRNTSAVAARGNGEVAVTYSPGAVRGGNVICDIFVKRGTIQTSHVDELPIVPIGFVLHQNYPNPFNPSTTIRFSIPPGVGPQATSLRVYDLLGREVATLIDEVLSTGSYSTQFEPVGLASGVYHYRLQVGAFTATKSMVVVR